MFDALLNFLGFGPDGYGNLLVRGMVVTMITATTACVGSLLLGAILASVALSKHVAIRLIWKIYRSIFSSIPTLLVLFVIYFGASAILSAVAGWDVELSAMTVGILSLVLVYSTFMAEVFRGGVLAVARGQHEACMALGIGFVPSWGSVILPQVIRYSLPGVINNWVILLKDTALVSVIGVADVVRMGQVAGNATGNQFGFLTIVGAFFVVFVALSLAMIFMFNRRHGRIYKMR